MGWGHLKILFLRTMKPEKLNFTWKLSDMEQRQVDYIMGPRGSNGNEMHIIFLHGPRLLRWAMWPLGLLFIIYMKFDILLNYLGVWILNWDPNDKTLLLIPCWLTLWPTSLKFQWNWKTLDKTLTLLKTFE
jgi:hypothetical protein